MSQATDQYHPVKERMTDKLNETEMTVRQREIEERTHRHNNGKNRESMLRGLIGKDE